MPKFVIEREIPGARKLAADALQGISRIARVIDPTTSE
jgi:hypothetical protein